MTAGRLFAHELDGILIAKPIRTLDGVIHMPAPIVFAHVREGCANAALRRHGMTARRKHLGDASRRQTRLRKPKRCAQTCASGTDHQHVVVMISETVRSHQ
jgi:hypothetical protein